jgi:hypothetical protein
MEFLDNSESRQNRLKRLSNALKTLFKKSRDEEVVFPAWADDRTGFWPENDRGGATTEYRGPGDRGVLGVIVHIEMNEEDGRPLNTGLPPNGLSPK